MVKTKIPHKCNYCDCQLYLENRIYWKGKYYCGSAGHFSQEAVKRYIQEQKGKDVFEYSVFGSPNQKIGNFTQSKLSRFGGVSNA